MIGLAAYVLFKAMKQAEREHDNEQNLARRSQEIRNIDFNLNAQSELEIIEDFRFRLPEVRKISSKMGCCGVTKRNMYSCDSILAYALFLHHLSKISRWHACELNFRIYTSQISEIFWKTLEAVLRKFQRTARTEW